MAAALYSEVVACTVTFMKKRNVTSVKTLSIVVASVAAVGVVILSGTTHVEESVKTPAAPVAAPVAVGGAAANHYSLGIVTLQDKRKMAVRWNPCQTITYRVNPSALPAKKRAAALADAKKAVSLVSKATGIPFSYKGTTKYMPPSNNWWQNTPSEIVIAWGKRSGKGSFPGVKWGKHSVGIGSGLHQSWATTYKGNSQWNWDVAIGRGAVWLTVEGDKGLKPGFGKGVTRGSLLLHELGHVMGLKHNSSKSVLMYPSILSRSSAKYQSGDLTGLRKLGRSSGCIAVPTHFSTLKNI